ncbi:hypothetical protein BD779DRAFT_1480543 [Infundibulicybe gibba]|nr:hypothetical protein BD779DRAFT_1480543 [Infundibulicybe gibba]
MADVASAIQGWKSSAGRISHCSHLRLASRSHCTCQIDTASAIARVEEDMNRERASPPCKDRERQWGTYSMGYLLRYWHYASCFHMPSLAASWSPQRWRTRRRHDTFVPFTFPSLALGGGTHDGRAIPWLEQRGVFSDALEWGKRPAGGSGCARLRMWAILVNLVWEVRKADVAHQFFRTHWGGGSGRGSGLRFLHDFVVERLGLCSGLFGSLGGYLPFAIRCSSNEHSDERDNRPAHARGVRRDSFEAKEAEVEAAIPLESIEAEAEPEPAGEPERAKLNAGSGKQYSGWQYLMRDPSGLRPQRSALSRRCGAFTAGRVAVVEAGGAGVVVVVAVVVDVAVVVVAAVVGRGDAWAPAESRCMSSDVVGAAGGISTG